MLYEISSIPEVLVSRHRIVSYKDMMTSKRIIRRLLVGVAIALAVADCHAPFTSECNRNRDNASGYARAHFPHERHEL
jgi:hypothetical protein